jgi:hypothetical protein
VTINAASEKHPMQSGGHSPVLFVARMTNLHHLAKHAVGVVTAFAGALVIKYLLNRAHGRRRWPSIESQGGLWGDWVGNFCVVEVHFGAL